MTTTPPATVSVMWCPVCGRTNEGNAVTLPPVHDTAETAAWAANRTRCTGTARPVSYVLNESD